MTADQRKSLAPVASAVLPVAAAGFVIYVAVEAGLLADLRLPSSAPLRLLARLLGTACLPLAIACARLLRRHEDAVRRPTFDHCPGCGYDLSATPARCPECGRVP
jgi:hypothetical protein